MRLPTFTIPLLGSAVSPGPWWLAFLPAGLWGCASYALPLLAPTLDTQERWLVALVAVGLVIAGLFAHVAAHLAAARFFGARLPERVPLHLFGDAAQVWPYADSPSGEVLSALAGPVTSSLLVLLSYLLWDRQIHPYVSAAALIVGFHHGLVAAVSLAPGFPLDGGRLVRGLLAACLGQPAYGQRAASVLGYLITVAVALWSVVLLLQNARFSLEAGLGTLGGALLLLLALRSAPAAPPPPHHPSPARPPLLAAALGLVGTVGVSAMLAITAAMLPTLNGLYLPGEAVAVTPMIRVPLERRHQPAGEFYLTTILAQTPILAGQWAYAQIAPAYELVPPERVVPPGQSPQQVVDRAARMLDESERVAQVVALRLAGYKAAIQGVVLEVVTVVPGSPSDGRLQPGDRLLSLDGARFPSTEVFVERIRARQAGTEVLVGLERAGRLLNERITLAASAEPGGPALLGVSVQSVAIDADLPFPITIIPQKIVGGPSAGLMFTLTIYNLITPDDLTGGRRIAGTGTINLEGQVGPIGGVAQKVAAAEHAGAEYFLAPPENYAEALEVARRIKVVRVATVEEALAFLRGLPPVR